MIIKLDELFCHNTEKIAIDEDIIFDNDQYTNNEIRELKKVHFQGEVHYNNDESIGLEGLLTGTMVLTDAISLDDVNYDFSCEIDENIEDFIEKEQNTIDILQILWQNIVLEIPIKYTLVEDLSKYCGDGWKVISEDDIPRNNPFEALKIISRDEKKKEE